MKNALLVMIESAHITKIWQRYSNFFLFNELVDTQHVDHIFFLWVIFARIHIFLFRFHTHLWTKNLLHDDILLFHLHDE